MADPTKHDSGNKPPDYKPPTSADELIQRYQVGERHFWEVDIPEKANLRNAILAGATFNGGFMSDLDFRGANLQNVKFLNCNVKCTDFRGADLQDATFRGSSLEATYFENANLTGVSFAGAYVYGYELKETDGPDSQGQF